MEETIHVDAKVVQEAFSLRVYANATPFEQQRGQKMASGGTACAGFLNKKVT